MTELDPNGIGTKGKLFGLPYEPEDAQLVILPVPWEVTVSYGAGTADAPQAILEASTQVDLGLNGLQEPWKLRTSMLPVSSEIYSESEKNRGLATRHILALEDGEKPEMGNDLKMIPKAINEVSEKLNIWVSDQCRRQLKYRKIVGLIGGDHSTPLGLIRSLSEFYPSFGILQIDAHADLRNAYEGFAYSHASIMYNALKVKSVSRLVQVGVRDFCDEEVRFIENSKGRVVTFFDDHLKEEQFRSITWHEQCERIIAALPDNVYISFDIDGLDPSLCPNTGTPVPGGLSFQEATYLIRLLVREGKRIIGFDLSEVSPAENEWDANVGARLLYYLSCWTGASQGLILSSES